MSTLAIYARTSHPEQFRVVGEAHGPVRLTIDYGDHGRVDVHLCGWEELRRFVNHLEEVVAAADCHVHAGAPGPGYEYPTVGEVEAVTGDEIPALSHHRIRMPAGWRDAAMHVVPIDGPAYEATS